MAMKANKYCCKREKNTNKKGGIIEGDQKISYQWCAEKNEETKKQEAKRDAKKKNEAG